MAWPPFLSAGTSATATLPGALDWVTGRWARARFLWSSCQRSPACEQVALSASRAAHRGAPDPKPPWESWISSIDADACGNRWNTDGSMAASMRTPHGRLVSEDDIVVAYDATAARRDAEKLPAVGDSKWPL